MTKEFDYSPKFDVPILDWDWCHPFHFLTMPEIINDYAYDMEGEQAANSTEVFKRGTNIQKNYERFPFKTKGQKAPANDNKSGPRPKTIYRRKRNHLRIVDNNRPTLLDRIFS